MSDEEEQYRKKRKKNNPRRNPVAGVKEDFNALIQKFADSETVRYVNFSETWKEMKMSLLQSGRQTEQETREFLEDVFAIAVAYYLPPHNFQVRSAGLYIMYGLYNTQFCVPPVKFRMLLSMWKDVLDYQKEAHNQQHYDIDFVFHSLKALNAFQFVSCEKERFLVHGKFRHVTTDSHIAGANIEKESKLSTLFTKDHLKQLTAVDLQYQQLKIALAGPTAKKPDISLAVIHQDLINSLNTTIQQNQERIVKLRKRDGGEDKRTAEKRKNRVNGSDEDYEENLDDESDDDDDDEDWNQGNIRAKIKAKAFSNKGSKSKGSKKKKSPAKSPKSKPSSQSNNTAPVSEATDLSLEHPTATPTKYINMPDFGDSESGTDPVNVQNSPIASPTVKKTTRSPKKKRRKN